VPFHRLQIFPATGFVLNGSRFIFRSLPINPMLSIRLRILMPTDDRGRIDPFFALDDFEFFARIHHYSVCYCGFIVFFTVTDKVNR